MLTEDDAIKLLGSSTPLIRAAWLYALDTHLRNLNHPGLTKSVRGGIIQNLAVFRMRQLCDWTFRDLEQRQILIVDDTALICFKTLDEHLHCKGPGTNLSEAYYRQQQLPGFPDLTHLIAGAVLSDDYSQVIGAYLVCPSSQSSNNWYVRIEDDGMQTIGEHLLAPDEPDDSSNTWKPKKLPPSHDESTGDVG